MTPEPGTADRRTPDGLRLRAWAGPSDLPGMHRVAAAARLAAGDPFNPTLEQMASDYAHLTNCDPAQDVVVAELDGAMVAYGRTWWQDRNDGIRAYQTICFVDPERRRQGIGGALQRRLEERCVAIGADHDPAIRRLLVGFGAESDPGISALLGRTGYRVERRFVHMVRPTLDAIEVPPMPDGLEIRPATMADARALFEGDAEAFRDHWGATDESDEAWIRFRDRPGLDPSLWVVAWDGDAMAGAVQLEIDPPAEDRVGPQLGWLARVWVRRPWRQRGLASALIGRSLVVLRERGTDGAQLGVDVDNAQRALDLYTRAGFEIESSDAAWCKPWPVPVPMPDGGPLLGWQRR